MPWLLGATAHPETLAVAAGTQSRPIRCGKFLRESLPPCARFPAQIRARSTPHADSSRPADTYGFAVPDLTYIDPDIAPRTRLRLAVAIARELRKCTPRTLFQCPARRADPTSSTTTSILTPTPSMDVSGRLPHLTAA